MISVETKGTRVVVAGVEMDPSDATDLAAEIRSHAAEARANGHLAWREEAEAACLAEGHRLAAEDPTVRLVGGSYWRVAADGAVSILVPARRQPDLAPSWSVASELPPEWPILWVRLPGGRVRHAWRGGQRTVCGAWLPGLDMAGSARNCPKCEARA